MLMMIKIYCQLPKDDVKVVEKERRFILKVFEENFEFF
jgi:hypothetical protein